MALRCCCDDASCGCEKRVLSIQSSVVWGYVGNKAATFPLQLHGFDVSPINTVQFSNHTEYGHFEGQVLNDKDLSVLVSGLKVNRLLRFSYLMTGYIGSKCFLEKVAELVKELRMNNSKMTYVCDPVMGDGGHLYVPEDLVQPYKDLIVPLADVLTPNQFELQLLTDMKVGTEAEALRAMEVLHQKGVRTVVLSSSDLSNEDQTTTNHLLALASTVTDEGREVYRLAIPRVEATFVGTGDLFACSLLVWLHKDADTKQALEKTVATVQAVMANTLAFAEKHTEPDQKPGMAAMELRMVQSKADIEKPVVKIHASKIPSVTTTKS